VSRAETARTGRRAGATNWRICSVFAVLRYALRASPSFRAGSNKPHLPQNYVFVIRAVERSVCGQMLMVAIPTRRIERQYWCGKRFDVQPIAPTLRNCGFRVVLIIHGLRSSMEIAPISVRALLQPRPPGPGRSPRGRERICRLRADGATRPGGVGAERSVLFDHLVGAREERLRHGEAKGVRSLQINDQL